MKPLPPFLFSAGKWEGRGVIHLTGIAEELPFIVTWTISPSTNGTIWAEQRVSVEGFPEALTNLFTLKEIKEESFSLTLENPLWGQVEGRGLFSLKMISWEFRGQEVSGFEVYNEVSPTEYTFFAEYLAEGEAGSKTKGYLKRLKD